MPPSSESLPLGTIMASPSDDTTGTLPQPPERTNH